MAIDADALGDDPLAGSKKVFDGPTASFERDRVARRYQEKGHAYFSKIARRLELIDPITLVNQLDDAECAGRLSADEVGSVLCASAIFAGLRRSDEAFVHLLVEASPTIAGHDVDRARKRAELYASAAGTEVVPVVAGEVASPEVVAAAQEAGVWCVTYERAISPNERARVS